MRNVNRYYQKVVLFFLTLPSLWKSNLSSVSCIPGRMVHCVPRVMLNTPRSPNIPGPKICPHEANGSALTTPAPE